MVDYVTLVGSRETPDDMLTVGEQLSSLFFQMFIGQRTGEAKGMDTSSYSGVFNNKPKYLVTAEELQMFVPKNGAKGFWDSYPFVFPFEKMPHQELATNIAEAIHPYWEKCTEFPRLLHSRNIYQVLGPDLLSPSRALFCWGKKSGDSITGGTRTAFETARNNNIPVYNLNDPGTLIRINKAIAIGSIALREQQPWLVSELLKPIFQDYFKISPEYEEQFHQRAKFRS